MVTTPYQLSVILVVTSLQNYGHSVIKKDRYGCRVVNEETNLFFLSPKTPQDEQQCGRRTTYKSALMS